MGVDENSNDLPPVPKFVNAASSNGRATADKLSEKKPRRSRRRSSRKPPSGSRRASTRSNADMQFLTAGRRKRKIANPSTSQFTQAPLIGRGNALPDSVGDVADQDSTLSNLRRRRR